MGSNGQVTLPEVCRKKKDGTQILFEDKHGLRAKIAVRVKCI